MVRCGVGTGFLRVMVVFACGIAITPMVLVPNWVLDRMFRVVSESGQQLGRVHDVRGELVGGRLQVTGLVAGELGILERYGVGTHGSGGPGQAKVHSHPVIPWGRVVRVGSEVVIRDESATPS
jgi:sporulation protein YlmC with PRC-barrel domain